MIYMSELPDKEKINEMIEQGVIEKLESIENLYQEKIEKLQELETKLKDYIGDVESISQPIDIFQNDKTTIVVVCSKHDFNYMMKNNKDDELIILKANPLCQLIAKK